MALDTLIGTPLILAAAMVLAPLFGLALLGAAGRELVLVLLRSQSSLKPGAPCAAVNSSHH
jgi:hypothetical protein